MIQIKNKPMNNQSLWRRFAAWGKDHPVKLTLLAFAGGFMITALIDLLIL